MAAVLHRTLTVCCIYIFIFTTNFCDLEIVLVSLLKCTCHAMHQLFQKHHIAQNELRIMHCAIVKSSSSRNALYVLLLTLINSCYKKIFYSAKLDIVLYFNIRQVSHTCRTKGKFNHVSE